MDRPSSVRTAAAAALLSALLIGCGDGERDKTRERVDAYVEGEQHVMQRAQPEFLRANETFLAYARGELSPKAAARGAARAERSIRNARDGVAVLDPPAEAQALHDELLRYLQMNVEIARETERLASYVPAARRALRPLGRANRALESRLADAQESDAQADALERFYESVGATLADLRRLDPPAVLEPAHRDQAQRLAQTRRLAGSLRRALIDQDAERVARLLKRFRTSASERRPRPLAAAQALSRYTRRLQQLNDVYADIQREQLALDRRLR
jgi:hypothetical protein